MVTSRRARLLLALLLGLALLAGACSSDGDDTASSTTTTRPETTTTAKGEAEPGVVKIGVIAPLDDGLTAFGRGIASSVELAVDEANARDAIPGFTIEVVALDDSSDPATGREAAEQLAADPAVIGVVGPYNSGVAAEVAPILEEAGIPLISPGNTDPTLTLGEDPTAPERQFENYFRMVATDAQQGPLLATYARDALGAGTAAVVSETKPVSAGLAEDFAAAFSEQGGTVAYETTVPDGTTDFSEVVAAIGELDTPPDVLFFGGEYAVAAAFRASATAAGITAPMMGGDGIKDDAFIADAGPSSEGTIASTVGVPLDALSSAADFVAAYEAAGFDEPPSDFGPYAYDAANLLIDAAAGALADTDVVTPEARAAVIAALGAVEATGVTGAIAFDELGDTTTRVFTIYRVEGDAWVPVGGYIGYEM